MVDSKQPAESLCILMLEDSNFDAELISEHLARLKPQAELVRVVGKQDYLAALSAGRFDVILCDYSLPGFDGLSALQHANDLAAGTPFIFVSGVLGEEVAIASFNNGATDYVLKQRLIRLPAAVERAAAESREKAERKRAEEQMNLLVAELSHRVKNTLAMVTSIIRRTARGARGVEDYEAALLGRIGALSEAHALLFEANWHETDLEQVLQRTLEPFRRRDSDLGGFRLSGPRIPLDPKAALALSLVFHELATNAVKYGALSSENGLVTAEWNVLSNGGTPDVKLLWRETGGPAISEPGRAGFGTTLLERSVAYELEGAVAVDYRPDGLRCELRFPMRTTALEVRSVPAITPADAAQAQRDAGA